MKERKKWKAPVLKIHGTVANITGDETKKTGHGDYYCQNGLSPLNCC